MMGHSSSGFLGSTAVHPTTPVAGHLNVGPDGEGGLGTGGVGKGIGLGVGRGRGGVGRDGADMLCKIRVKKMTSSSFIMLESFLPPPFLFLRVWIRFTLSFAEARPAERETMATRSLVACIILDAIARGEELGTATQYNPY